MKKIYSLVILMMISMISFGQLNVTLRSHLPFSVALSNIGGYVDSSGNEYALVGTYNGLSIVDVTDPANPVIKFNIPGTNSDWREVKTWQNYAYVTTEGCCNGLQILNLGYLPDSVPMKYYKGNGAINNQINRIHALHIDAGFAYLYGSDLFSGAAIILDLSNPWSPNYMGHTPGTYIHDGYVRNDTLFGCHIYDGYFSVIDVTNKANPVTITTQNTPNLFTHNSWLNDAGNVLFTTDEVSDSYLTSYDISDLNNITELNRIQLTPGSGSIVHNTHTLNDFEVVSWYKDGIAIVDASHPDNMIVTGSYDTYSQGSGDGFNGCWGVYPYLPSGNLVVSDIDNGLYVLTPTYVRGCYLEGNVTDSVSGSPLNGVTVTILTTSISKQTKITGDYKTGLATAGTYDVQFSKAGYVTKTITGVSLQNGVLTNLNVQLTSFATITATGTVINSNTGAPIANATIHFSNSQFDVTATTNASGQYTLNSFYGGTYDITAGKWGFRNDCSNQSVTATPLTIYLTPGYYDDFALDFGWAISGPSGNTWERAIPVATMNNSAMANPGSDVTGDCGDMAFVTDNGGGGPWDNDVDNGATILTSPSFDGTLYTAPRLSYARWFYNGGTTNGQPDDTMSVYISNGTSTVLLERTYAGQPLQSQWVNQNFLLSNFIALSNNMHLIVNISDPGPVFNIVEGGLDNFKIDETVGLSTVKGADGILNAYPNPFINSITFTLAGNDKLASTLVITDITGRVLEQIQVTGTNQKVEMGKTLPAGLYIARLMKSDGTSTDIKITKQ
ncbi:MAG TPA: choice-of-anchor B family protein [Bacteroidia bacterium]|jgi:choice-of-anchor B domain-containing protein|nr:choice-of-anchor B family protein [Bacteroidia bacterium]